jgi:hypothetical protein
MRQRGSKGSGTLGNSSGIYANHNAGCASSAAIANNPSGSDVGQAVAYAAHAAGTGQAAG